VDSVLLAKVARHSAVLGAGNGKRLLAGAPSRTLPEAILCRDKTGFTTPVELWMPGILPRVATPEASPDPRKLPWARQWAPVVSGLSYPHLAAAKQL
jgi:hypothetical protein